MSVKSVRMTDASVDASVDSFWLERASTDTYYTSRDTRTDSMPSVLPTRALLSESPNADLLLALSPVFKTDVRDQVLRRSLGTKSFVDLEGKYIF